jgi:hypothetical protein
VDGFVVNINDRILVWKQSIESENGIYVAAPDNTWNRSVDFSIDDDVLVVASLCYKW